MAYSVLHECDKCGHSKVCNKEEKYKEMQRQLRRIDTICSDPDIQVSVACLHYLGAYIVNRGVNSVGDLR